MYMTQPQNCHTAYIACSVAIGWCWRSTVCYISSISYTSCTYLSWTNKETMTALLLELSGCGKFILLRLSLTQFVAFSQQVFILALALGRGFKKGVAPSAREARSDCQKQLVDPLKAFPAPSNSISQTLNFWAPPPQHRQPPPQHRHLVQI